jgi:hypothetical protein
MMHPMLSNIYITNNENYGYDPSSSSVQTFRFPSKEERLRYYMGDWYNNNNNIISFSWNDSASFCKDVPYYNSTFWYKSHDTAFLFDAVNVQNYSYRHYTKDMEKYLFSTSSLSFSSSKNKATTTYNNNNNNILRLAISVGDQHPSLQHPVILKSRELKGVRIQQKNKKHANAKVPILALMNEKRHYGKVGQLKRRWMICRPWHLKRDRLVWRGAATGQGNSVKRKALLEQFFETQQQQNTTSTNTKYDDNDNDMMNIDIAFEPKLSMRQLLQSKYLLSLEGNDVASGLKWMLYSNSVVFMPPPTHVSWAMEDLLVPYVHYVPVLANLSDLSEKVEWARRHDDECRTISRQATKYMEDLYTSRTAKKENRWIMEQIVLRYQDQFGDVTSKCPKERKK